MNRAPHRYYLAIPSEIKPSILGGGGTLLEDALKGEETFYPEGKILKIQEVNQLKSLKEVSKINQIHKTPPPSFKRP